MPKPFGSEGTMRLRLNTLLAVLALFALGGGAIVDTSFADHRKRPPGAKAKKIKKQLTKRLVTRGLDNVDLRRCLMEKKMIRKKHAVHCTWYAEGVLPGPQPYRCRGDALHGRLSSGKVRFIRISTCINKARTQIPVGPEPVHEPRFGYNDEWHIPSQIGPEFFSAFDRLEPDFARSGLEWQAVEYKRGSYDWRVYDRLYAELRSRGIAPLWSVTAAPCFAQVNPDDCQNSMRPSPEFYDEMAEFAAAAVKRYPEIGAMEVWNEPNAGKYWRGRAEPELYAKMFKTVRDAVKRVDPSLPVLFGSLSPHATSEGNTVSAAEFLQQGYDLGAVQKADGISTHPYPGTLPGEDNGVAVAKRLGDLWAVMERERDTERPLWITETGVSTHGDRAFTPQQQAEALVQIYEVVRRIPQVKTLLLHRFRDSVGDNAFEPGYGSVDQDGNPKAAYCALGTTRGLSVC